MFKLLNVRNVFANAARCKTRPGNWQTLRSQLECLKNKNCTSAGLSNRTISELSKPKFTPPTEFPKKAAAFFSLAASCVVYAASKDENINLKKPEQINLEKIDPKTLTHKYLINQAVALTVDSVTNILTQTTLAILEADENYRQELENLVSLLEEQYPIFTKNVDDEKLWDQVVALRSESESKKNVRNELEGYLQSVINLMNKTAEVAFLGNCDYASIAASERLASALSTIDQSKEKTKKLETEYLKLYGKVIAETGKKKQRIHVEIDQPKLDAVM